MCAIGEDDIRNVFIALCLKIILIVINNVPSKALNCVRVHAHAHTGRETCAHKKTWSAHKCSFQKMFCTYWYTSFQIQMS